MTTKKVVEETVKVVFSPEGEEDNEKVELVSSSTKESENLEIFTSSLDEGPVLKTIPVQTKARNQKDREPETAPTTPQKEAPPPEKAQEQPPQGQEEDETQHFSEPETAPTPPPKEAPPPKITPLETPQEKVEERRETRKRKAQEQVKQGEEKGQEALRKKKRRKRRGGGGAEEYKRYVFKVMKQVHPDMGISSKAMTIINNLMSDMFERIAVEAARLQRYTGRRTLSSREIQGAVKLVLPRELGKHAIAEGTKAISNYISHVSGV